MELLSYFQPIVYVKLHPDTITLREVKSGHTLTEPPVVAISREARKRVLGVGETARAASAIQPADLVNPFKHPRSLLSDFTVAEVLVKGLVKKLFKGRLFVPSPILVLHPRVDPEGGFTQIEIRAFRELAIGAGASRAVVWHGRDLTDDELRNLRFQSGGQVLG